MEVGIFGTRLLQIVKRWRVNKICGTELPCICPSTFLKISTFLYQFTIWHTVFLRVVSIPPYYLYQCIIHSWIYIFPCRISLFLTIFDLANAPPRFYFSPTHALTHCSARFHGGGRESELITPDLTHFYPSSPKVTSDCDLNLPNVSENLLETAGSRNLGLL